MQTLVNLLAAQIQTNMSTVVNDAKTDDNVTTYRFVFPLTEKDKPTTINFKEAMQKAMIKNHKNPHLKVRRRERVSLLEEDEEDDKVRNNQTN